MVRKRLIPGLLIVTALAATGCSRSSIDGWAETSAPIEPTSESRPQPTNAHVDAFPRDAYLSADVIA